jgi:hypothetical protein
MARPRSGYERESPSGFVKLDGVIAEREVRRQMPPASSSRARNSERFSPSTFEHEVARVWKPYALPGMDDANGVLPGPPAENGADPPQSFCRYLLPPTQSVPVTLLDAFGTHGGPCCKDRDGKWLAIAARRCPLSVAKTAGLALLNEIPKRWAASVDRWSEMPRALFERTSR